MTAPGGRAPTSVQAVLAAAVIDYCRRHHLTVDGRLRLLATAPDAVLGSVLDQPAGPDATIDTPGDLGRLHETLVWGADRVVRGAWYTPEWLATQLVAESVHPGATVADPSCGGGVFLLAAAAHLHASGTAPSTVVDEQLWGADIDPLAVAVTEAALWLWSAERGEPTVAGSALVVGDALIDVSIPAVDVIVGNPPFLGQLRADTAVDRDRRARLRERWGPAMQPYTDIGWLFLLAAVESVAEGGSVTLVQPQSLLGARDGAGVRRRIDEVAAMEACWVDDGTTFDASVVCCAPRLRRRPGGAINHWQRPLIEAAGIPAAPLASVATVGSIATVAAGFRDEYYGLVPGVVESGDGPRLVTSGSIDPLRLLDVPVRFAKRSWQRPTVGRSSLEGRAAAWVDGQAGPKLIIASQTRVLEAAVDESGALVAGVPAIVVVPHDPDDLWWLAAAIHAPAASAWMAARTIGTALARDACRPTAALVGELPLPTDHDAWAVAATQARILADGGASAAAWDEFGRVSDLAYGVEDPACRLWWKSRLPLR